MKRSSRPPSALLACAAALVGVPVTGANAQPAGIDVLRIGISGELSALTSAKGKEGALQVLRGFIKSETGLDNDVLSQKDWRELADKMAGGRLHLGVFPGYEFAWAQARDANLKPLALAVNVYRYPTAHVVTRRDDRATDFAGLRGHSLVLLASGGGFVRLFLDRECQARGKAADEFFSRVASATNAEDALDDLVDGKVQAVAADRAALEAYKRRKPGRFGRLKEVACWQPVPPVIVAYHQGVLDEATLQRFRDGLLRASRTDRGQTLLTFLRLTGFDAVPPDLGRVLAETRKAYPPPGGGAE